MQKTESLHEILTIIGIFRICFYVDGKLNIHGSKFILSIWSDRLCVVYYQPLKSINTITEHRYWTLIWVDKKTNCRNTAKDSSNWLYSMIIDSGWYITIRSPMRSTIYLWRWSLWHSPVSIYGRHFIWSTLQILRRSRKSYEFVIDFYECGIIFLQWTLEFRGWANKQDTSERKANNALFRKHIFQLPWKILQTNS